VRGEKAAGCWSLVPSAAGQMFWTFLSSPPARVENSRTTCGRPVSMSTCDAQFTAGSNFSATRTLPFSRFMV
jgi:hypothetical protein